MSELPIDPTPDTIEDHILEAAYHVFSTQGLNNARMQDIADKAGISRTVLNYYFRTKDKLFREIAGRIIRQAVPTILLVLNGNAPLEQKIRNFVHNYMQLLLRSPFIPLFIINELHQNGPGLFAPLLQERTPALQKFFDHLEREMQAGTIRRQNPKHIFMNMISLCIFPFVARPLLEIVSGTSPQEMDALLAEREKEIIAVILKSLQD
jgi:AcrR family transcriptional regulator